MNPWLIVGAKYHDSESISKWNAYFNEVGSNRCPVFVDMKEIIAKRIAQRTTLPLVKIASIIGLNDHASALFLLNGGSESEKYGRKKSRDYKNTEKYIDLWINERVYPITYHGKKDSEYLHFKTNFKLIKL